MALDSDVVEYTLPDGTGPFNLSNPDLDEERGQRFVASRLYREIQHSLQPQPKTLQEPHSPDTNPKQYWLSLVNLMIPALPEGGIKQAISQRLKQARRLGLDVPPYSHLSEPRLVRYYSNVTRRVISGAAPTCREEIQEIETRNSEIFQQRGYLDY